MGKAHVMSVYKILIARNVITPLALTLVTGLSLAACQTGTQTVGKYGGAIGVSGTGSKSESSRTYSFFFDQTDHLKELVAAENFKGAIALYDEQEAYFQNAENAKKAAVHLAALKAHYDGLVLDGANENLAALKNLSPKPSESEWISIQNELKKARGTLALYPDSAFLKDPAYRLAEIDQLSNRVSSLQNGLKNNAAAAFAAYDHFGQQSFFKAYPIKLDEKAVLGKSYAVLEGPIDSASKEGLEQFIKNYPPKEGLSIELFDRASRAYREQLVRQARLSNKPQLARLIGVAQGLKAAGFKNVDGGNLRVALVDTTSEQLARDGLLEFKPSIREDIPLTIVKMNLKDALTDPDGPRYVIVVDTLTANAKRKVLEKKTKESTFLNGHRTVANPRYQDAVAGVGQALSEYNNARYNQSRVASSYCDGLGCLGQALAIGIAAGNSGTAADNLQTARDRLKNMPRTLEEPIYDPYNYLITKLAVQKHLDIQYFVIDRDAKTIFKSRFQDATDKTFNVAYRVHPKDPVRRIIKNKHAAEEEVSEWEEAPMPLKLSLVVDDFLQNSGNTIPLPDYVSLKRSLERVREKYADNNTSNTDRAEVEFDKRFSQVVKVFPLSGGVGTGFYVTSSLIMTNAHVVGNSKFIDIEHFNKEKTSGKVVALDERRDLALIKVQTYRKPLLFFSDKRIRIGQTIEVIGHPLENFYTLSRGIISSVRSFVKSDIERTPVLHLQIDAATSPGNSGGPVLINDKVVGIQTAGNNQEGAENLNYSVHYSEALDFIREHLPNFRVSAR